MNAKIPVRSAHIDYEHLYERIKMYRKEKNIKQHEIAIQLGYEPANYGKIERGARRHLRCFVFPASLDRLF